MDTSDTLRAKAERAAAVQAGAAIGVARGASSREEAKHLARFGCLRVVMASFTPEDKKVRSVSLKHASVPLLDDQVEIDDADPTAKIARYRARNVLTAVPAKNRLTIQMDANLYASSRQMTLHLTHFQYRIMDVEEGQQNEARIRASRVAKREGKELTSDTRISTWDVMRSWARIKPLDLGQLRVLELNDPSKEILAYLQPHLVKWLDEAGYDGPEVVAEYKRWGARYCNLLVRDYPFIAHRIFKHIPALRVLTHSARIFDSKIERSVCTIRYEPAFIESPFVLDTPQIAVDL
ncbi:hypothetical protein K2O51_31900 (plasmid) [Cupriavidus pinatubonensis]|uniref:hypothetical protein n=1 Tax=Cupriavidus pinatubonensis TaxID=248026 RepID=UPI001C73CE33|nr:hypothetical protein [Cupriavidus pinatubonensis]QYY33631.1 hypothetical protein K2O51_31900 [Cupriavidus pinatubonensis]